jgi:hypothetical protein
MRQLNGVMASFRRYDWGLSAIWGASASDAVIVFRGAFVVVISSELLTDFDQCKKDVDSNKKTHSFGLAPVMAAFIQVSYSFTAVFWFSKN